MARRLTEEQAEDLQPDEDLTTPESLLHAPFALRLDPERIGSAVGRAAAAYVREPENIAAFSGSVLLLALVSRGRRMPLLPALMISLMGNRAGVMAWRSYKNLETIAQAQQPPGPVPADDA